MAQISHNHELASCEPYAGSPILNRNDKHKPSRPNKRAPAVKVIAESIAEAIVEVSVESAKPAVDNPAEEFNKILKEICFKIEVSPGGFTLTYDYPEKSCLMTGRELAEKLLTMLSEERPVNLCSKNIRVVEVGYTNTADGHKRWFVRINDNVCEVLMLDYRDSVINIKYQDGKTKTEKDIVVYPKKSFRPIVPEKKIVSDRLEHGWYRLWTHNSLDPTSFRFMEFDGRTLMRRCYCDHSDNSHCGFQYYLVKIVATEKYEVAGKSGKNDSKKKITVEILEHGVENGMSLITPSSEDGRIEFYEV